MEKTKWLTIVSDKTSGLSMSDIVDKISGLILLLIFANLSKEFFRQWLINNNFQGKQDQELPEITDEIIDDVSNRYIELFNLITGNPFKPRESNNTLKELETNIIESLST